MLTLYGIMTTKTDSPHIAPISLRYRSDIGLLLVLYLRRGADERRRRLIGTDELERDAPEAPWRRAGERADSGAQVSLYSHIGAISERYRSDIGLELQYRSDIGWPVTRAGRMHFFVGSISGGHRYRSDRGPISERYRSDIGR